MTKKTIVRPDRIRQELEWDVLPKQLSCQVRLPGGQPEAGEIRQARGGLLAVQMPSAERARRGALIAVEICTKIHMYVFYADVHGTQSTEVLLDIPRVLEVHQRRSSVRERETDLRLRVRYLGSTYEVVLSDVSMLGIGFLFSEFDLPGLTIGTRVRAHIERRVGDGHPILIEIVQRREAPGTGLEFAGGRIVRLSPAGQTWLAEALSSRDVA